MFPFENHECMDALAEKLANKFLQDSLAEAAEQEPMCNDPDISFDLVGSFPFTRTRCKNLDCLYVGIAMLAQHPQMACS